MDKFRGKSLSSGEWLYGCHLMLKRYESDAMHSFMIPEGAIFDNLGSLDKYEVLPESVSRCIGLCDADGRELYIGDVLMAKVEPDDTWPNGAVWYIQICEGKHSLECSFSEDEDCDVFGLYTKIGQKSESGDEMWTESFNVLDLDEIYHVVGNVADDPNLFLKLCGKIVE